MKKVPKLASLLLIILATQSLAAGSSVQAAPAASLYLSPASANISPSSKFSVSLRENSGTELVNVVQAHLTYRVDKLVVTGINSSAAFNIKAGESYGSGSINVTRGAVPPVAGDQLVVTIDFLVVGADGTAAIDVESDSKVVSSSSHQNILKDVSGASYQIGSAANVSSTEPPAPPARAFDTRRPKVSAVGSSDLTTSTATISWTTSEPATSEVVYGLNKAYGLTAADNNLVKAHKIVLSSALLTPGTLYHYMVKSVDPSGNAGSSADYTFTTKGATLLATVVDQHHKPVKGAKVSFASKTVSTDSAGLATLTDLPYGGQTGVVSYQGRQTPVSASINSPDQQKEPQKAQFKIRVPPNYLLLLFIAAAGLLAIAAELTKTYKPHLWQKIARHLPTW